MLITNKRLDFGVSYIRLGCLNVITGDKMLITNKQL